MLRDNSTKVFRWHVQIVPIRVTLRNRMLESSVQFFLSVEKNPGWEVIGFDVLALSLQPSENVDIPMEALIPRAGIHNLQGLQVTVRQGEEDLPFPLPHQWLIHVTEGSPN